MAKNSRNVCWEPDRISYVTSAMFVDFFSVEDSCGAFVSASVSVYISV